MNPIVELEASDSETKTRGAEHHSDREFEDDDDEEAFGRERK
jgi:hypothetical protein